MYAKQPFSHVLIKTKQQRMKLPKKPTDQDIQVLKKYPYHQQKLLEKQLNRNPRDQPLNSDKQQFKKYLTKPQYFSQPQVIQGEKISPVERFRLQQEQKKKRDQEFNKKLKGQPFIKIKKGAYTDKATGVDRFKDIRQGQPNKLGIIDIHKKTQEKRPIKELEVSLFLKEDRIDPSFNPLIRVDEPVLNIDSLEFNHFQRPQILTYTSITKPLKRD